jgi:hypothetical protein
MNSSTSSFRTELKVVAGVILVLLGVEVVMRSVEERLSVDIAHIRSGEEIAGRLKSSAGPGLLLLGNSLTREGIAPELLSSGAGGTLTVEAYHPDGSSVNEWSYAYRRFFDRPGVAPDFLIIGAGRSHLFDSDLPPENFGAYYCGSRDLGRYFARHVHDPDDAARFLLARFSVAFTNRRRVQPRLFTAVIPHYQEVLRILQTKPRLITAEVERDLGHRNLAELLKAAGTAGTRVAVVAIPMPDPYPLPDSTVRIIRDGGAILIDARGLDGIQPAHFPDGYHLDPDGATILTEYLITQIGPHWWSNSTHGD